MAGFTLVFIVSALAGQVGLSVDKIIKFARAILV